LQAQQLNPHSRETDLALGRLSQKGFWAHAHGWWRQLFDQ
jgi:hypothetical protein